ncbi:tRNA (adenosine(37)-N6)-dimethylallyltransferase MiaA [Defluviimonas sp. WL0075]|uniref:tRNA dimethylallyltransferase n=1 Tax=Albidovulum sediminicola TaxID=2984331 RepID=A0ABT2Z029_9RHOB|nr:tRNA (adenosine(37)-N6)-dimethylallyltransferase MiaA [Defluviimonas sp. WL0075]MCV2864367.1 tRNA (adenosine(37)-N6)-dimethylallyltransferase MiaA [Defluviimonas sp. WL0075]
MLEKIKTLSNERHVLIAGPTASGKSALALAIAETQGGVIVNADALQVWNCWRILSARPSPEEEAQADHRLYGHLPRGADYSVGHWLREISAILGEGKRLIVVGGTGLYLSALTEGLAEIPPVPAEVRAEADALAAAGRMEAMIADLDPATAARIDLRNPARVQRAWEVQRATGRGIAAWQDDTGPALLPLVDATAIRLECDRDWLAERIDRRFRNMLTQGALDEARAALPHWDPAQPWAKAIGAPELIAHLRGETALPAAVEAAQAASRQYAKRQRTWLRSRMAGWMPLTSA